MVTESFLLRTSGTVEYQLKDMDELERGRIMTAMLPEMATAEPMACSFSLRIAN